MSGPGGALTPRGLTITFEEVLAWASVTQHRYRNATKPKGSGHIRRIVAPFAEANWCVPWSANRAATVGRYTVTTGTDTPMSMPSTFNGYANRVTVGRTADD